MYLFKTFHFDKGHHPLFYNSTSQFEYLDEPIMKFGQFASFLFYKLSNFSVQPIQNQFSLHRMNPHIDLHLLKKRNRSET